MGKNYCGWQYQPNALSVQEKLEGAISKILRDKIRVVASGRTDAGVHASQMFVHLDANIIEDFKNLVYKVNAVLPNDIVLHRMFKVKPNAHARFDVISRTYQYRIFLGRNPFLSETSWQIFEQKLDVAMMNKAARILLDYTNFSAFSRSKTDVKTYNCNLIKALWIKENHLLTFHITANRFLRNMVRAIVGTLIDIGKHKISLKDFQSIVESYNRSKAGMSAPARGLFLTKIIYPESIKKIDDEC